MSPFWFDLDPPIDEEAEILELEREHRESKANVNNMFATVVPIGKTTFDVDEDDVAETIDDEETTSSDDDDMDDDDDSLALYQAHADVMVPDMPSTSGLQTVASPAPPTRGDSSSSSSSTSTSTSSSSSSSSSSGSSATSALDPVGSQVNTPSGPQGPAGRPAARTARMVIGRHTPANRPGMPTQPVQIAYMDPTGLPVHARRASSGSISPTSRAYLDAALHSPSDVGDRARSEDSASRVVPSRTGRASHAPRPFPGPVSDHLSRYHEMVAAGHIRPSISSAQIDNLIESMHQAQRTHAARASSQRNERDAEEAGPSRTPTYSDSD